MPIYEYECSACRHRTEAMQALSDVPLSECPECRQASLRRLVSAAGFRLKGTGWYATDFRGVKPAEKAATEAGGKGKTGDEKKVGGEQSDSGATASGSTSESKPPAPPAE